MTFANPLPWWALVSLFAALAGVAWFAYRGAPFSSARRFTLASLRFLTLALLTVLLMRPVAQTADGDAPLGVVPILVDTSRSMAIDDAEGARRIDRAKALLVSEILPALAPHFTTEVLAFGEALAAAEPDGLGAAARRSDLAVALEAVRERYRGRAVPGIVLLSDGGDTTGAVEEWARQAPAPVYAYGIGSPSLGRDREVLSVTAAEAVLDDSRVDLQVSAVSHGFGGEPIELRLLENGSVADVRRVRQPADGVPIHEVFQVTPRRGAPAIYTVEVPAAAGELVPENNARSVLVQVPARPRRILLAQGAPGHEHAFLRRAWRSDSGLEVDSVVRQGRNEQGHDTFYIQAAPGRGARLADGYPSSREDLFAYDGIVLANVDGGMLQREQLRNTRDFVGRRGGGLLVLGGQSFMRQGLADTALEEVIPLDLAGRGDALQASSRSTGGANRVGLTAAGEAHPIMQLAPGAGESTKRWEAVPAVVSSWPLGGPRPGASVLAVTAGPGGSQRPLIAVQRYGEGRAMVFTGEGVWRWRMLLPADDTTYETFWRQALRWLSLQAPDPVRLMLPAGAAPGESLVLRAAARTAAFDPLPDASVEIRVEAPDGRVQVLAAARDPSADPGGLHVARYRPQEAGVYRVSAEVRQNGKPLSRAVASMLVGGADVEMADPRLNLPVLQRLAAGTGGRVVPPGGTGALAGELRAAAPMATLLSRRDLWHNGWWFALVVGLLASEWVVRRRSGLR